MVGDVLVDRYELEELVGSGGMSSVYRAHDKVLERKVALKVLHATLADQEDCVERFRREARMVAGLQHQNIVGVIDRGEDDGCPFIVLEFVGGRNLKQLVEREGPLPFERALELGMQIARGLAFAHANGFVHRDVKPQNVLLNGDGEAKVTDFGIARSLDLKHGVTQTGTVLGTSDYIAPEQAQGQQVDEHTDIYSLGIVLYEMLTGEVPFAGDNFVAVAMQHINETPPRVSERRPDVPPRLDAAVARALAKQPDDRFATMNDLGRELEACLDELRAGSAGSETVVRSPAPKVRKARTPRLHVRRPRRRPATPALLVAIGLAAAVAALAIALARENGGSGKPASGGGAPVSLSGVGAYDPPPGNGREHDGDAGKATDGNTGTYWETEHYRSSLSSIGKSGVGLVIDAGTTATLHQLTVTTNTPGFTAEIQAGNSAQGRFHSVSGSVTVTGRTTFDLSDAKARYFVVWITNLGSLAQAHVNEVSAS
jgi:eukaryotic-like serine/threonine-protein kinase